MERCGRQVWLRRVPARCGMAGCGATLCGVADTVSRVQVRPGLIRSGGMSARCGRCGSYGKSRSVQALHGATGHGTVWQTRIRWVKSRSVEVGPGEVWSGVIACGRRGEFSLGAARSGPAWCVRLRFVAARFGMADRSRRVLVSPATVRFLTLRQGMTRLRCGRLVEVSFARSRWGWVGLGTVRFFAADMSRRVRSRFGSS